MGKVNMDEKIQKLWIELYKNLQSAKKSASRGSYKLSADNIDRAKGILEEMKDKKELPGRDYEIMKGKLSDIIDGLEAGESQYNQIGAFIKEWIPKRTIQSWL